MVKKHAEISTSKSSFASSKPGTAGSTRQRSMKDEQKYFIYDSLHGGRKNETKIIRDHLTQTVSDFNNRNSLVNHHMA